jgi:curved DNA-binding protein CbpA
MKNYFGERPGDDTGMRTAIWGPGGWLFLHSIAQNYPWKPTMEQKENYYNFFRLTGNVLPCRYCRESYQQFITEPGTRLTINTMRDRKSVVTWLYRIHNKVNKKLDIKGGPTLKEVWDKYESFRSVCHKTPKHIKKKGCTVPLNGIRKKCVINFVDEKITQFGKKKKTNIFPAQYLLEDNQEAELPQMEYSDTDIHDAMELLQVERVDDIRQIKKKYHHYSRLYHPDRPTADEEMFKRVANAYQLLMDYNRKNGNSFGFGKLRLNAQVVGEALDTLQINIPFTQNELNAKFKAKLRTNRNKREIYNAYFVLTEARRQVHQNNFGKKVSKKSIKLISIKKSTKSGKKLMATFETNGRRKVIHFGASGMRDFTIVSKAKNKDAKNIKQRYIQRHRKDFGTGDPSRAGYLSMFVLWNKPSLQASIADYKRRLNAYNTTGKFPTNI